MKKPTIVSISLEPRDMASLWGEVTCLPSDVDIHCDVDPVRISPYAVNFNATVQCTFDLEGNICRVLVEFLGQILDPYQDDDPDKVLGNDDPSERPMERDKNEVPWTTDFGLDEEEE